jgi:lysosomal acid phosphatase
MRAVIVYFNLMTIFCELRFVFELFRHGARAPHLKNHTDILGNKWDNDNELTSIGLRMEYLLGYRNRQRYADFLNPTYSPSEVYIMSTVTNRTVMSAYTHLQGLYSVPNGPVISNDSMAVPPVAIDNKTNVENELGNYSLANGMQVVPVHIIPKNSRTFYLDNFGRCEKIKDIMIDNLNKESIKSNIIDFKEKYANKLVKIIKNINETFFDSHDNIWLISDAFYAGYLDGRHFENFKAEGIHIDEFVKAANKTLYLNVFDFQFDDDNLFNGHFSMSPLHQELLSWMSTKIHPGSEQLDSSTKTTPKLVLLSGHDTNIAAMQSYIFKVFPGKFEKSFMYPDFASSFYYELHRKDGRLTYTENDHEVIVRMNDFVFGSIDYIDFKRNVTNLSFSQEFIDDFCQFNGGNADHSITLVVICLCLTGLIFGLVVITVALWLKKRSLALQASYRAIV